MKRWTVDDLRALDACAEQVAMFEKTFPDGATADDVGAAVAAGLNVEWLVLVAVSDDVWAEYNRQRVPLWVEYDRQCAPLWQCVPLRDEFRRQLAQLRAEFERQCAPLWADALRTIPDNEEDV